jgi:hypothetical protein
MLRLDIDTQITTSHFALPRVRRTSDEWKKRASLILFRQESPRKRCYPRADLLAYLRSLPPGGNSASGTSDYLPHLAAPEGTDNKRLSA